MRSVLCTACFLLTLVFLPVIVDGGYTVKVKLLTYQNPTHFTAQDEECCDTMCDDCDNRFTFCFSDNTTIAEYADTLASRPEELICNCQYVTRELEDGDNITFEHGELIDGDTPNPLVFTGERWKGYANLLVIIFDVDTSLDDIVDGILIPLRSDVRKGFCEPTLYTGYFGYAQLEVRFRVDCDNNFYGEDCTVFCRGRDNEEGHYECDKDGNPICIEGYRNVSSNCTECVPALGCSLDGGFCSQPGECICRPGYSGDTCTTSNATATIVLGTFTALLSVLVFVMVAVVVFLCIALRRRGRVGSEGQRASLGYYMNEGLGPTNGTSVDGEPTRFSRHYDIVQSGQRAASLRSVNRVNDDVIATQDAATRSGDVPSSSLQRNIAYGVELGANRGTRNGVRLPPYKPRGS